jgi:thioredoxin 1
MLWPVIEELAEEHKEIKFVKIDVDEVTELAAEYQISSIPTVFIWYNHEIKEWFLGANPKEFYEEKIANAKWEMNK